VCVYGKIGKSALHKVWAYVHTQYLEGPVQMFQTHGTSKIPIIKKHMNNPKEVNTVADPTAGGGTDEA
jgi:hypothetical protein